MRYKIVVEYDGTNFAGWQIQTDAASIQGEIEQAIFKVTKEKCFVYCAGRTDAGVHARGQVAHFDLEQGSLPPDQLRKAINFHLNEKPISILSCLEVNEEFHARFSAKQRHYRYLILNRASTPALDKDRVWYIRYPINLALMIEASKLLLGNHDFSSFRSSQCQAKSPIKTIDTIEISRFDDIIQIDISALSFLHHMVRNIVGSLAAVGTEKISTADFKAILDAKDRKKAGVTAPACGLFFMNVDY